MLHSGLTHGTNDGQDRLENFLRTRDLSLLNPPIDFEKNVVGYEAYWKNHFQDEGCCCCPCFVNAYRNPGLMSGPARLRISKEGVERVEVGIDYTCRCCQDAGDPVTLSIPFDGIIKLNVASVPPYSNFGVTTLNYGNPNRFMWSVAFLKDPERAMAVIELAKEVAGKKQITVTATGPVSGKLKTVHLLVQSGALQPAEADSLLASIVVNDMDFCGRLLEAFQLLTQADSQLRLSQQQFEEIKALLIREVLKVG